MRKAGRTLPLDPATFLEELVDALVFGPEVTEQILKAPDRRHSLLTGEFDEILRPPALQPGEKCRDLVTAHRGCCAGRFQLRSFTCHSFPERGAREIPDGNPTSLCFLIQLPLQFLGHLDLQ